MADVKRYLIDTNALLDFPEVLNEYHTVINSDILRELESLENKYDGSLKWKIRRAKKAIEDNKDKVFEDLSDFDGSLKGYDSNYIDNKIIEYAKVNEYGIISFDRLVRLKADSIGIEVIDPSKKEYDEYKGFKEVVVNKYEMSEVYQNLEYNKYNLLVNQYVVFIDEHSKEEVDVMKWNGQYMLPVKNGENERMKYSHLNYISDFRVKDNYQMMAIDSIKNNQVTMIRGRAGSGKSLITLSTALYLMEKEGYRLVIFCNPTPTKDAQELGFRKGTGLEKVMDSSTGAMLKSKLGGEDAVYGLVNDGMLEILPFVDLRGWDSGENKTICWITEAQNLNSSLLKLGLQRITESAKVVIDGDEKTQVDRVIYDSDNGMKRASEVLRGSDLYGEVELKNVWRSRLADLVENM